MKKESLEEVTTYFEKILEILSSAGIEDEKIMSRYLEYRVAYELAKRGHVVQILNERRNKKADIYLPKKKVRVEVKSGKFVYNSSCASFGRGSQIKENRFDYCVFVPYSEGKVKEFLIFSREELTEVPDNPRIKFARYPKTNPCMIIRCDNYEDLKKRLQEYSENILKIEEELHKHPEKFIERWDKIPL
ncbi:MAG: hypothetical protein QXH53_04140 [Nitrososphaerales archaeon]